MAHTPTLDIWTRIMLKLRPRFVLVHLLVLSISTSFASAQVPEVEGQLVPPADSWRIGSAPTVALLDAQVPADPSFVLRGTIPVPEGITWQRGPSPVTVYHPSGHRLPTQWELVARRADGTASVVEILAHVDRQSLTPDQRYTFPVVLEPAPFQIAPLNSDALFLVAGPNEVILRAEDAYGNIYATSLTGVDGSGPNATRFHRIGPVQITGTFHGWLNPLSTGNAALAYFGGVQCWLTVSAGSSIVEMSLKWHDAALPALDSLYFKKLELLMPTSWSAFSVFPDPAMGPTYQAGGYNVLPIVAAPSDGTTHVLRQRGEREWRMVLFPVGKGTQALRVGLNYGWAVAKDAVLGGSRTWSWQNPATAQYMPQARRMPTYDHVNDVEGRLQFFVDEEFHELSNGLPSSPGTVGLAGYLPLEGVPYGGMTSGFHMGAWWGVPLLSSGYTNGLWSVMAEHMRYGTRQFGGIYAIGGEAIVLDDYLNPDGTAPWRIVNSQFRAGDDAPFYFEQANRAHNDFVHQAGIAPTYEADLDAYDSIDDQHLCRAMKDALVLNWLANDPLARHRIRMLAEVARMTYYEGPGGELEAQILAAQANPNFGTDVGRAEAWFGQIAAAGYSIGDDAWRARWLPWLETYADAFDLIQMGNGFFQAKDTGRGAESTPYGHQLDEPCPVGVHQLDPTTTRRVADHRNGRINEQAFILHALRGIQAAAFEGVDPVRYDKVDTIMRIMGAE